MQRHWNFTYAWAINVQEYFRRGRRCYQSTRRSKERKKFSETKWRRQTRGKQRRNNSLSFSLSVSFFASKSARWERCREVWCSCSCVRRLYSYRVYPFFPSSSFTLSSSSSAFFVWLVLASRPPFPSLASFRGSFHPHLRTLRLNDALRVFKQKFHSVEIVYPSHWVATVFFSPSHLHCEGRGV